METSKNIIFETASERFLVPWAWLLHTHADQTTSGLVLVFSGSKVELSTPKPFELLEAINQGVISRIQVGSAKIGSSTAFVDAITFRKDDDDE